MNSLLAFSDVLSISGITAVICGCFLIATIGYLLGRITVKGVSLGTAAKRKGGIFHICPKVNFAVFAKQSRPDIKMGIGGI